MPKGSEELTHARKEEIIDACAALYETMGFRDITIRDIGAKTSFTRTSIYNYFQTKEEIFLALLQREHEAWIADLEELARQGGALSVEEFADRMARMMEKRECMLKLMCPGGRRRTRAWLRNSVASTRRFVLRQRAEILMVLSRPDFRR